MHPALTSANPFTTSAVPHAAEPVAGAIPEAADRFVLDEAAFVAELHAVDLPSFLTAPRAEYLGMIERGAV